MKYEGSMLKKVLETICLLKPSYALMRMGFVEPTSTGLRRLATDKSTVPLTAVGLPTIDTLLLYILQINGVIVARLEEQVSV